MLPPLDPESGRLPQGVHEAEWDVVEAQSGLAFSEFFQNERDTGRKGIVVIRIGGQT